MSEEREFKPARERQVDTVLLEIGTANAQRRRLARLTQQTLADKAHVSRSTVARNEAGDPGTRLGMLVAVTHALGLGRRVGVLNVFGIRVAPHTGMTL